MYNPFLCKRTNLKNSLFFSTTFMIVGTYNAKWGVVRGDVISLLFCFVFLLDRVLLCHPGCSDTISACCNLHLPVSSNPFTSASQGWDYRCIHHAQLILGIFARDGVISYSPGWSRIPELKLSADLCLSEC